MGKRYKIWLYVERCTDFEEGDESYEDIGEPISMSEQVGLDSVVEELLNMGVSKRDVAMIESYAECKEQPDG